MTCPTPVPTAGSSPIPAAVTDPDHIRPLAVGECPGLLERLALLPDPRLARRMLERALAAGAPAGWVTADAVYGNSPTLRGWLETRRLPYVLAVKATEPLPSPPGPSTSAAWLAESVPPVCWLRISAG
jgi:DDE superfamily endonuclease